MSSFTLVSFQHTKRQAKSLGLRGWCMNTRNGTVKGRVEGPEEQITEMQRWLKTTGSPKSRIEKAVFSVLKEVDEISSSRFDIRT